jgi:hypothetical protein
VIWNIKDSDLQTDKYVLPIIRTIWFKINRLCCVLVANNSAIWFHELCTSSRMLPQPPCVSTLPVPQNYNCVALVFCGDALCADCNNNAGAHPYRRLPLRSWKALRTLEEIHSQLSTYNKIRWFIWMLILLIQLGTTMLLYVIFYNYITIYCILNYIFVLYFSSPVARHFFCFLFVKTVLPTSTTQLFKNHVTLCKTPHYIQNFWGSALDPSSGILKTRKHNVRFEVFAVVTMKYALLGYFALWL